MEELTARGLSFEWASGRVKPERFTMSLHPTQGGYRQILIDVPWMDDLEALLASAVEALRRQT